MMLPFRNRRLRRPCGARGQRRDGVIVFGGVSERGVQEAAERGRRARQMIRRCVDEARCRNGEAPPEHRGPTWLHASHQLTGAAMSRTFSQLEVNVWRIWAAVDTAPIVACISMVHAGR